MASSAPTKPAPAGTTDVDVVLVGLPGSGKSAVGRRLAQRHHVPFMDLDERIEARAGRRIPEIFEEEGEAAFRAHERAAIGELGEADASTAVSRVVATGGGAVVDPRNRWALYRGRMAVWLDGRPEVLAQRLRRSPNVRPLIVGRDPVAAVRDLAARRERFYAAAAVRINGVAEVHGVLGAVQLAVTQPRTSATKLLDAETKLGRYVLGEHVATDEIAATLRRLDARRAVIVSEPGAWAAAGAGIADGLATRGWSVEPVMLPQGEDAKRLSVIEDAARELARLRVERRDPMVAIGGGALGDAAGFLAATFLRGIPLIHVPTTLVAQVDSSIGGKTGVDLPEGKNLVGAFHQPAAVVIDVALLATLPERDRRAALGEAVKMAVLGDERLFALLEADGDAIARGETSVFERGTVAELVERAGWAKVEIVSGDEREQAPDGGRILLNLGHSLGHAVEAAGGYRDLLHGEAVAYGLRAACAIGEAVGVTPVERSRRIGTLLDALALATEPLPYALDTVLDHLAADKKHAAGRLRWVLPTESGVEIRDDVPEDVVARAAGGLLAAGSPA
jgi:shikimate kinase/3-dehydroquinate synthase